VRRLSGAGALSVIIPALLFAANPVVSHATTTVPSGTAAAAQVTGPVLQAKFTSSLSTRNAKAGDDVKAKTLKSFKMEDGTELPKGSVLSGKVTMSRSRKDGNGNAILTFRFDQVQAKGGAVVPVHGLVVAIGPALAPKNLFGAKSILQGGENTIGGNTIDPSFKQSSGGAMDEDDIPMGSSLQGVALGRHMDADWTTALQGIKTDIDLDSDVVLNIQLR